MPKQTLNYRLGYFAKGEMTNADAEQRRWNTVDGLLRGLYDIVGNGVISGMTLTTDPANAMNVIVVAGEAVISGVSVVSNRSVTLGPLVPETRNYINAVLTSSSYFDQSVTFISTITAEDIIDGIKLGSVVVGKDSITSVDATGRRDIGILASIKDSIKEHRHNGAEGNPNPIDLGSEVQGKISLNNLPDIDASLVSTGTFDRDRIPKISHLTGLTKKGTLTHAQLDSFVQILSNPKVKLLGDTFVTNLLQLILVLKEKDPQIDEDLINELTIIPGISPDSYFDMENTTADVDLSPTGTHLITGTAGTSVATMTKTWNTKEEFLLAKSLNNVSVDGDVIRLRPTVIKAYIDDFENVSDWTRSLSELSSGSVVAFSEDNSTKVSGEKSGKIQVNSGSQPNVVMSIEKSFPAQNWEEYGRIVFYLDSRDIDHGDIFFYIDDCETGIASSTLVLNRGEPTINRDTLLNGWREISVDISGYSRSAVNKVGFKTSSANGWDVSKPFSMNIDEMYLTSGNKFVQSGSARFRFGKAFGQTFKSIGYSASIPSGTSVSVRYRVANSEQAFDNTDNPLPWINPGNYTSPIDIVDNGELYNYIEIEFGMQTSQSRDVSPELHRLFLDYSVVSSQATFTYNTQDAWESGCGSNIDTKTIPGKLRIDGTGEIGGFIYGSNGEAVRSDDSLNVINHVVATSLPKSTPQLISGSSSGLGQISSIDYGPNGQLWLADTDNDRVILVDKDGNLIRGFYGSFLQTPVDCYGEEERGPGSNKNVIGSQSVTTNSLSTTNPKLLQAVYNPDNRMLSLVFDQAVDYVHTGNTSLKKDKLYLAAQSHRIYFGDKATFSLYGIEPSKYEQWKSVSDNPFANQFFFKSHIMQVKLSQIDAASLGSIVDFSIPSLRLAAPVANQLVRSTNVFVDFVVSNLVLGGADRYAIKVKIDGGEPRILTSGRLNLTGLTQGIHEIDAVITKDGIELENAEARVYSRFFVWTFTTEDPYVQIESPLPNQQFSSSVTVYLSSNWSGNFQYTLDDNAPKIVDEDTFVLSDLTNGSHVLRVDCIHNWGELANPGMDIASASVKFFVGASRLTGLKVYADRGLINAVGTNVPSNESVLPVDIAPVIFSNIYAPIEVQYLAGETSQVNPSGAETIVVAKMRSPSTTNGLNKNPLISSANSPEQNRLQIFGTKYLDGHSVVQIDMNGNTILSNNAAVFAQNKDTLKIQLGSVQKVSNNEFLIADAERKRAIITVTDLETQTSFVSWQYNSDRPISDFRLVNQNNAIINVSDDAVNPKKIYIKTGTFVTWVNNCSSSDITIYSGKTTPEQFNKDPDVSLYGDEFYSQKLRTGEKYSFRFLNIGQYNWFVYPSIATGEIVVTSARVATTDKYLIVENDINEVLGGRVVQLDAWGNIEKTFGEGYLYRPKDARMLSDGSIIIST